MLAKVNRKLISIVALAVMLVVLAPGLADAGCQVPQGCCCPMDGMDGMDSEHCQSAAVTLRCCPASPPAPATPASSASTAPTIAAALTSTSVAEAHGPATTPSLMVAPAELLRGAPVPIYIFNASFLI